MPHASDPCAFAPIAARLGAWYDVHRRDLPWRDVGDAYRIWLSEVILQQTRVAQGLGYYRRFVARYPTVEALAAASEDEVLKLWQGLGYYSRARNLLAAARQVMTEFGGVFPTRSDQLSRLRGIGAYTAAAVASFSAGEAVAVVDGNVARVLARLFDIAEPVADGAGRRLVEALADAMLDRRHPARHNQAMMELGALVCLPSAPTCADCPVAAYCEARRRATVTQRPVRRQRGAVPVVELHYLVVLHDGRFLVHRREGSGIWQGLYEFVRVDGDATGGVAAWLDRCLTPSARQSVGRITPLLAHLEHRLTHRQLIADVHVVETTRPLATSDFVAAPAGGYRAVGRAEWDEMAVPRPIAIANEKLFAFLDGHSQNNL